MYIFVVLGDDPIKLSTLTEEEVAGIIDGLGGVDDQEDDINYFFAEIAEANV